MNFILDLFIYLFSILGGIVSIWTIYKWIRPYKNVSWKEVEKGVLKMRDEMIKDNFHPSLIVGIGRGGSIIGALISGTMGNIPIMVIDRIYNWSENQREDSLFEQIKLTKQVDSVLLVDGEMHTGNTVKTYLEYFKEIELGKVKVLTYMKESFPSIMPDYYYLETDNISASLQTLNKFSPQILAISSSE